MSSKIKVLIADDHKQTLQSIVMLLSFEDNIEVVGTAKTGLEAVEKTKALKPQIVLMDSDMPELDGLSATRIIDAEMPYVGVIVMGIKSDFEFIRKAMQAGAKDCLHKPFGRAELITSLVRVVQRNRVQEVIPEEREVPKDNKEVKTEKKIITVLSAKGGAGTTSVAINLADQLRKESKQSVCLVDLDLQYGDIGVMINADHKSNIVALSVKLKEGDDDFINSTLWEMHSGVKVLLAPLSPELADMVTVEMVKQVIDILHEHFDYLIIDGGCHLTDQVVMGVDLSDSLIIVGEATIPGLKNTKLLVKMLTELQREKESMLVVMNMYKAHLQLSAEELGREIQTSIKASLPDVLGLAKTAIEKGVPIVQLQPNCEFSRVITKMALWQMGEKQVFENGAGKKSRFAFKK